MSDFFSSNPKVKLVRLQWVDYSGVVRTRIVPTAVAKELANGTRQYSLVQNCMIIPISTAPACFPDGIEDWKLIPDWSSICHFGPIPNYAAVMCFNANTGLANPRARCPRSLLHEILSDPVVKDLQIQLGFEIEFSLLDSSRRPNRPLDRSIGFTTSAGLRAEHLDIIDEIVKQLQHSSIEIYHFHVEMADQYEIALAPLPPMEAIDALIMAEETLRMVAVRQGLTATLSPKPVYGASLKNGLHVHLSLGGQSKTVADSFLAGVLEKVKPLCALGLANHGSYNRVTGDCAGEWIGYGTGNKDLPIRKVNDEHWEFRFLDATANAYLFIVALLCSGVAGVKSQQELTMKDCQEIPSLYLPEDVQLRLRPYGITAEMPRSLAESLASLKADEQLREWLGDELLTQYIRVKEKDDEKFTQMQEPDRIAKLLGYF